MSSRLNVMTHVSGVVAWNINHRAARRRIPSWVAASLLEQSPDIVVLSEYVEGEDHERIINELARGGLRHLLKTCRTTGQNQMLVAARSEIKLGRLPVPQYHPSVSANILHVTFDSGGLSVVGFRRPTGRGFDTHAKRQTVDWIVNSASLLGDTPAIIVGDFNAAPRDRVPPAVDVFERMRRTS